jgi:hypothetical protein
LLGDFYWRKNKKAGGNKYDRFQNSESCDGCSDRRMAIPDRLDEARDL